MRLSGADQACYLAKDNGRNRVQIYHPDDKQVQVRHGEMQWVERLHAALEEERFAVVAQEIRPVGARWSAAARCRPGGSRCCCAWWEPDGEHDRAHGLHSGRGALWPDAAGGSLGDCAGVP